MINLTLLLDNAHHLFQNQASTDESVCRVYEVGRMRRADEEDEQVREVLGAWCLTCKLFLHLYRTSRVCSLNSEQKCNISKYEVLNDLFFAPQIKTRLLPRILSLVSYVRKFLLLFRWCFIAPCLCLTFPTLKNITT